MKRARLSIARIIHKPRFACRECQDTGLVTAGADVPCECASGDMWRKELELRANPPKCRCGQTADYCLHSPWPVCKTCWPEMFAQYCEARATGKIWEGWKTAPAPSVPHGGPSGEREVVRR